MKILIVGPKFFSYTKNVSDEFHSRGIFTKFVYDTHSLNIFWRVAYRLRLKYLYYFPLRTYYKKIFRDVMRNKITNILFLNAEAIDIFFLIRCKAANIKIHFYFWDSVKNKPIFINVIKSFATNCASFDPIDCKQYKLKYIPLFATKNFFYKNTKKIFFMSSVGTFRYNRAKVILQILKKKFNGLNFYLFMPSWIHSFFYFLNFNTHILFFNKIIFFKPISLERCSSILKSSFFSLDINSMHQSGLTSRTFESLAAGCFLLTTNPHYKILPKMYHKKIIYLNDTKNLDILDKIKLKTLNPISSIPNDFFYYLSIERFVDELLDFVN